MVTDNVCFGVTASTSYLKPYILARTYSSLDHLTNGRIGWNIVTSYSKEAATALGQDDVVAHDKRYDIADEFMDVLYKYVSPPCRQHATEPGLSYGSC